MELIDFTHEDIDVTKVTSAAAEKCENLLILGLTHDGELYAASSTGDLHQILWWLETFKHKLLSGDYYHPTNED